MKALGVFGEKGNRLGVFGENGNLLGVSMERANSDCNGERSKKRSIEAVDGSGSDSNSEFLGACEVKTPGSLHHRRLRFIDMDVNLLPQNIIRGRELRGRECGVAVVGEL